MTESVLISTANFTKTIGQIKQFPYNLADQSGVKMGIYLPIKSKLFKDLDMTQPVTTIDDPVRVMVDLSGNGNHWVAPSDAARPLYKETAGKGYLKFDGTSSSMALNTSGLGIFSKANYAVVINALNLTNMVLTSWKYAFILNTLGNTPQFSVDSVVGNGSIGMRFKRINADATAQVSYPRTADTEMFTFDASYVAGNVKTYKNMSGEISTTLGSTGQLPDGSANTAWLGNYNGSGFAEMEYHGGVLIATQTQIPNLRQDLENWMLTKI